MLKIISLVIQRTSTRNQELRKKHTMNLPLNNEDLRLITGVTLLKKVSLSGLSQ